MTWWMGMKQLDDQWVIQMQNLVEWHPTRPMRPKKQIELWQQLQLWTREMKCGQGMCGRQKGEMRIGKGGCISDKCGQVGALREPEKLGGMCMSKSK